jgi:hypoxanthine phosphoribosyltransferase
LNNWQEHIEHSLAEILIDEDAITEKIRALGRQVSDDYRHLQQPLIIIGVLRGSVIFMSDLIRELDLPLEIDFMAISSYGSSTKSSGNVRIIKDISEDIHNRHILIVEDIIDTGLTVKSLSELLAKRNPASIKICALLDKPSKRTVDFQADYIGFTIPDQFVVGYGLDYKGYYRHLRYIGVLKPEAYA